MAGRGVDAVYYRQREEEGRDTAILETRCLWCEDWTHWGTAKEGREEALKHRLEAHPGIKITSRRKRKPAPTRWRQVGLTTQDKDEVEEERRKRMFVLGIE